jgi:mycofactocin precursor
MASSRTLAPAPTDPLPVAVSAESAEATEATDRRDPGERCGDGLVGDELLVEEISIDGMCGVY